MKAFLSTRPRQETEMSHLATRAAWHPGGDGQAAAVVDGSRQDEQDSIGAGAKPDAASREQKKTSSSRRRRRT